MGPSRGVGTPLSFSCTEATCPVTGGGPQVVMLACCASARGMASRCDVTAAGSSPSWRAGYCLARSHNRCLFEKALRGGKGIGGIALLNKACTAGRRLIVSGTPAVLLLHS